MIAVGAATGPASNSTASTPGQADQLFYETRNNRVIAHGNVEIYYNNFIPHCRPGDRRPERQ